MATTQRPTSSIRTTDVVAITLAAGDKLIIDRGIVLSSASNYGVSAVGGNDITINGVAAGTWGVRAVGADITVGKFGVVSGGSIGIYDNGQTDIKNFGIISGGYEGVAVYGGGKLTNHGEIIAEDTAGGNYGAIYLSIGHTSAKIINTGTVEAKLADGYAIFANTESDAPDTVINSGKIKGNVFLSNGADVFDSSKGQVSGTVDGGLGKDRLIAGKDGDNLIGGWDNDRLTGGKGSDTFEFKLGDGKDIITNFDAIGGGKNQDYLELAKGTVYTEKSAHNGQDTVLDLGDGQTITLLHVKASDFSNADIHFYV